MTTMTRGKTYVLTAIAALVYIGFGVVFADNFFTGTFWDSGAIFGSTIVSYTLLAAIIAFGLIQARRLPADGVAISAPSQSGAGQVDDPVSWKLILGNVHFALLWLPLRFFVGQQWLSAGEGKVRSDAWMDSGVALRGFWENAVGVPGEPETSAITYGWFQNFLQYMLDNEWYTWFAPLVAIGQTLVGLGLIVGALVGIAAFFGTVLNFSFQLAGAASTNPVLFGLSVFIILGWKVAGYWGLDRWLLPALGTPWKPGPVRAPDGGTRPAAQTG